MCVNALLQAFAFPRGEGGLYEDQMCVNALLQAFAFPPIEDWDNPELDVCVNALLQAFAFPLVQMLIRANVIRC